MKRLVLPALALLAAGWSFAGFKPLSFSVTMDSGLPVVEWAAESEDDLHHYEVEVRTQFSTEPRVVDFEPHGARQPYVFRDDDLYKGAEMVEYAVYAVLDSGERQLVGSKQINYTPTAVRRTWGSIKAMFQ